MSKISQSIQAATNKGLHPIISKLLYTLKPPIIYLAGPMECSGDWAWRQNWKIDLRSTGYSVIDPEELEEALIGHRGILDPILRLTDFNEFQSQMREIIEVDLQAVAMSDLVLTNYNCERTAGTIHEVGHAFKRGIVNYMVTSSSLDQHFGWMLGCIDKIFPDYEHAKESILDNFPV